MPTFNVHTIAPCGSLGPAVGLKTEEERLSADKVVRAANQERVQKRPKLTYSLSLCTPSKKHDIAVVGECSTRGKQIPNQIWIFPELADKLVTESDVEEVIEILKQEYEGNPLSLYFDRVE
jgi:hypothetical protein